MKKFFSDNEYKIYVENFGKGSRRLVLIPGAHHTGICFTNKPDGCDGWTKRLSEQFNVFVTDLPGTGRSGCVRFEDINGKFISEAYKNFLTSLPGTIILLTHSLSGPIGFKLAEMLPEKISHVISVEPGLIGNIQKHTNPTQESKNHVIAQFNGLNFDLDLTRWLAPTQEFIDRLRKDNTKNFPQDKKSQLQYRASLQAAHPRLIYERINIHGSQLKIENITKLQKCKFLVVTGTEDSIHATDDPKMVEFFKNEGIDIDHIKLSDFGIVGNGHMMMLESNSDEILNLILDWIKSHP